MSVFTRSELAEAISRWKAAYIAVASGKSYSIAGRSLTYQDVPTIRAELDRLEAELEALDGRSSGLRSFRMRMCR